MKVKSKKKHITFHIAYQMNEEKLYSYYITLKKKYRKLGSKFDEEANVDRIDRHTVSNQESSIYDIPMLIINENDWIWKKKQDLEWPRIGCSNHFVLHTRVCRDLWTHEKHEHSNWFQPTNLSKSISYTLNGFQCCLSIDRTHTEHHH